MVTRMGDRYDVFLSHSTADKPAVEAIAVRLRNEARLRPFLDKWHLVPGESWIPALEQALERSTTVAVFFGPQGRGAWHAQESQLALILAAEEHGKRVIPVLLPGARKEDVGGFMRLRTWVELGRTDGFAALVAGITGRAPGQTWPPSGPNARVAVWRQAAVAFVVTLAILGVPVGILLYLYYQSGAEVAVAENTIGSKEEKGEDLAVIDPEVQRPADELCVITCRRCPHIVRGWIILKSGEIYNLVVDGSSWRFHCLPDGETVTVVVEMNDGHTTVRMKHAAVTVTGNKIKIEEDRLAEGVPLGFSIPTEEIAFDNEDSQDGIEIGSGPIEETEGEQKDRTRELAPGQGEDTQKNSTHGNPVPRPNCARDPLKCNDPFGYGDTPSSGGDAPSVDCILDPSKCGRPRKSGGSSGSSSRSSSRVGSTDPNAPEKLSASDIKAGMAGVKDAAKACGPKHGAMPGEKVTIKLSFSGATGTVSKATPQPPHDGTPLGYCVAGALKNAKVIKFQTATQGASYSVTM